MDRRGFLGSLLAVTAAVASGVKLPSGKEVAKASPKALAVSDRLMAMLKDCNAVSITSNMRLDAPHNYEIEYIHVPGSKKHEHTTMIDEYTKGMRPVSVEFDEAVGNATRIRVVWV